MKILSTGPADINRARWRIGASVKLTTIANLAKYTSADRERILHEGAKKEGKLVWYTSLVPYKEIAKVFTSKYPGVARGHISRHGH